MEEGIHILTSEMYQIDINQSQPGNVVLLKDNQVARNEWPLVLFTNVSPSEDKLVRKVEIKVSKKDSTKQLFRTITETVLFFPLDLTQRYINDV